MKLFIRLLLIVYLISNTVESTGWDPGLQERLQEFTKGLRGRGFQPYKSGGGPKFGTPFLQSLPRCTTTTVKVNTHTDPSPNPAAPRFMQLGEASGAAETLINRITEHTESSNIHTITEGEGASARPSTVASITYPERLPAVRVATHFFRADYAVLSTPGGDIAELINGFSAAEKLRDKPYEMIEVNRYFQDFIRSSVIGGRQYFYHHTDSAALTALTAASSSPIATLSPEARNNPSLGCLTIKGMVSSPTDYGLTRKEIVEYCIKSFFNIYLDNWFHFLYSEIDHFNRSPLRKHLLYVVLQSTPSQKPGAYVYSPSCSGISQLLVPKNNYWFFYPEAVSEFRKSIAKYFSVIDSSISESDMNTELTRIGNLQKAKMMSSYNTGDVLDVKFISSPFGNPF